MHHCIMPSVSESKVEPDYISESALIVVVRQHCRLSICSYFGWVWQILRRLWRPPESGCGIFEEPQLSENWLQLTFFDGLALPHMSINFWICFWCILFTFQQRRRTFPPAFLFCQLPQIWEKTPIGLHKRLNFGKHSYWSAQNWSTNRNIFPNLRHWERCSVLGG